MGAQVSVHGAADGYGSVSGDYWPEFARMAVVNLLAVVSPGPDFAIVLK